VASVHNVHPINERSVAGVLSEIKDELKEFLQTRMNMLKSEMKDKISTVKTAVPMIAAGLLFGLTAWFVLTAALISIVADAFYPNRFAYFFSFVIVGVAYALIGGISAAFAIRELRQSGLKPERTIRVLKEDQVWLQTEARNQV
jgi:Putative Actinobacterial Holin-X, holin superfamily III